MKAERLLMFFMLVAFIARIFLCLHSAGVLIPKAVSDDMFYYLCIARNVADGKGVTADGVDITNGFHPLWVLILIPITRLFGAAAMQAALVALTFFSVWSAWWLYKILRFSCGAAASLFAAAVWLSCPYVIFTTLSGVEAPVFVLFLSIAAYRYMAMKETAVSGMYPFHGLALLGVAAGLAVLARLDGGVFAALLAAGILFGGRKGGAAAFSRRLSEAAVFSVCCAAVVLPWLIWSFLNTGYLFQTSGKAIYHQQHVIFWAQQKYAGLARYFLAWLTTSLSNCANSIGSIAVLCGKNYIVFFAALGICAAALDIKNRLSGRAYRGWMDRGRSVSVLLWYGIIIFSLYGFYLWYSQDWYFYSFVFAGCVLIGTVADVLDERLRAVASSPMKGFIAAVFFAGVAAVSLPRTVYLWNWGIRGWQADMYRAALWVRGNLPRTALIASFNSGILSYYCPQTVINLDGVVNGAAYRAITMGKIFSYVKESGIEYIVDSPLSLSFRAFQSPAAPPPPMIVIHSECTYPEAIMRNNPVVVYKLSR